MTRNISEQTILSKADIGHNQEKENDKNVVRKFWGVRTMQCEDEK